MNFFIYLLLSFMLNIAIEYSIVILMIRNIKFPLSFVYILLINLLTWPIANYLIAIGISTPFTEVGVILAEGVLIVLLFKIRYGKAFLASLIANVVSFLLGSFILGGIILR